MKQSVGLIHYSYPPVPGGVEHVIQRHARLLVNHGHFVRVVTGEGREADRRIELTCIPQLSSRCPQIVTARQQLNRGTVPSNFAHIRAELADLLYGFTKDLDVCMLHNVMTMHFNLPLTAALAEILASPPSNTRFVVWCHDAARLNPDYTSSFPDVLHYPWSLLTIRHTPATYVAISAYRRNQLAAVFGISPDQIVVVPNGLDPYAFLDVSPAIRRLARDYQLASADLVLFFPTRLVRRKRIEEGILIVKELQHLGLKVRFFVTALIDPHNADSTAYLRELVQLIAQQRLTKHVILLHPQRHALGLTLSNKEIRDLYTLSDALFITSSDEGFGLPVLEAGLTRLPVICSTHGPYAEVPDAETMLFEPDDSPGLVAQRIAAFLRERRSTRFFKRILSDYAWEPIYHRHLAPLLDPAAKEQGV